MSTTSLRNVKAYALTTPPKSTNLRQVVAYALTTPPGAPAVRDLTPTDYRKAQTKILYDLIEAANPGFQAKNPINSLAFGTPAVITPVTPSVSNTSLLISAVPNGTARGKQTITYRRINLATLFNNIKVTVTKYQATGALAFADFIALMNSTYGLSLLASDFTSATLTLNTAQTFTVAAGSLCYTGSFSVTWVWGKIPLSGLNTAPQLAARKLPTARVSVANTGKPQGELLFYDIDFTPVASTLQNTSNNATYAAGNATLTSIVAAINTVLAAQGSSIVLDASKDSTAALYGMGGLTFSKVAPGSSSFPAANYQDFNTLMYWNGSASSWFSGTLYFQYNN